MNDAKYQPPDELFPPISDLDFRDAQDSAPAPVHYSDPSGGFASAARRKGKPVPERKWLVPGFIPSRNVTILSGDGGTGKSLLVPGTQCIDPGQHHSV